MRDSARVFAEVVAIGDGLTSLADGLPVRHITCRHYHVAMKGKLSGCRLKSGVVGTVHCPLHRCKELMLDVGQRVQFDGHQAKGSELIRDYLVGAFEDCIGLRVGCGRNYCFDSIGLKEFLKLNSCEFGSFVVKTDKRSWVATEPGAIEGTSHGAAFFIRNNNQLE